MDGPAAPVGGPHQAHLPRLGRQRRPERRRGPGGEDGLPRRAGAAEGGPGAGGERGVAGGGLRQGRLHQLRGALQRAQAVQVIKEVRAE